jgi:hypothetical protein
MGISIVSDSLPYEVYKYNATKLFKNRQRDAL